MKVNKKVQQYSGIHYIKSQSTFSYELGDGEKSHQEHPETFEIPSRQERKNLTPGMNVKLIFQIRDGDMELTERMWVIVTGKKQDHYVGSLNNNPCSTTKLRAGAEVKFKPEHVINIFHGLIEDSAGDLPGKTQDKGYLAIGADLEHLSSVEQAEICHYLADQFDQFAIDMTDWCLNAVDMVCGYMLFTVYCDDPDEALKNFIIMLASDEFNIPKDDDDIPVVRFAKVCKGDPILVLFDLINKIKDEDCNCDDCLKAMKDEEAAQAGITGMI